MPYVTQLANKYKVLNVPKIRNQIVKQLILTDIVLLINVDHRLLVLFLKTNGVAHMNKSLSRSSTSFHVRIVRSHDAETY